MESPAACYAATHRNFFKEEFHKLDVTFRRLRRSVVGPLGGMDWTRPWHETLQCGTAGPMNKHVHVNTWSKKCLKAHWIFLICASYVALLPDDRWVVRALHWVPAATVPLDAWDDLLLPGILQSKFSVGGAS